MPYQKITLEVVVTEDNSEILVQALDDAMDKIEDQVTVFSSEIKTEDTGEPENAEEIAAPADLEASSISDLSDNLELPKHAH